LHSFLFVGQRQQTALMFECRLGRPTEMQTHSLEWCGKLSDLTLLCSAYSNWTTCHRFFMIFPFVISTNRDILDIVTLISYTSLGARWDAYFQNRNLHYYTILYCTVVVSHGLYRIYKQHQATLSYPCYLQSHFECYERSWPWPAFVETWWDMLDGFARLKTSFRRRILGGHKRTHGPSNPFWRILLECSKTMIRHIRIDHKAQVRFFSRNLGRVQAECCQKAWIPPTFAN